MDLPHGFYFFSASKVLNPIIFLPPWWTRHPWIYPMSDSLVLNPINFSPSWWTGARNQSLRLSQRLALQQVSHTNHPHLHIDHTNHAHFDFDHHDNDSHLDFDHHDNHHRDYKPITATVTAIGFAAGESH